LLQSKDKKFHPNLKKTCQKVLKASDFYFTLPCTNYLIFNFYDR
jgi:hypothetical protein